MKLNFETFIFIVMAALWAIVIDRAISVFHGPISHWLGS